MIQRLVLIDGHAILHRAYHALPPLTSRSGQATGAVYGFLTMLFRLIQDLKPAYLAIAFDLAVPTFRHEAYIAYQAQRPPTEESLKEQIELVKEILNSADIPIFTCPGFEADDIIGTIANLATQLPSNLVTQVIIVTGDRDIMQLVNDKVKVYAPIRGLSESKMFGEKEVEKYMGVTPSKIIDYKALVGDQSDNYPGVPGIGPKTAVELIKNYSSLENIYKALGTRQWALGESIASKLEKGREGARLSQDLARIRTDAPVKLDLGSARTPDLSKNEKFLKKLEQLGFKSLIKRLTGEEKKTKFQKVQKDQINLI